MTTQGSNGTAQLFKNPFLERLTRTNPNTTAVYYAIVISFLLFLNFSVFGIPVVTSILMYAGAVFFWTFFEYVMHRFVFHMDTNNKIGKRLAYLLHGVHHDYPRDTERLLMPPAPATIIITLLFGIYYLFLGSYAAIFLSGMINGYLIYGYMHYRTHVPNVPKWMQNQFLHHTLHHYKHPDRAFGVSSTFWDHVFGTMPPKVESGKLATEKKQMADPVA